MDQDDPQQHQRIVNGIFACQKSNITIDCLVLKESFEERALSDKSKETSLQPNLPYLMIQGAQLTGGRFRELSGLWCAAGTTGPSILLLDLISFFLPSPDKSCQALRQPTVNTIEQTKMSSTCLCHDHISNVGYACSNCLAFHCANPTMKQLQELQTASKRKQKLGHQYEGYLR